MTRAFQLGDQVTVNVPDGKNYPYVFRVAGFSRDGKNALLSNFTSGSKNNTSVDLRYLTAISAEKASELLKLHARNIAEGKFPNGGPAIKLAKKFDLGVRLQQLRGLKLQQARKPRQARAPRQAPSPVQRAPRQTRTAQPQPTELDQIVQRLIWTHGLTAFETSVQSFKASVSEFLEG